MEFPARGSEVGYSRSGFVVYWQLRTINQSCQTRALPGPDRGAKMKGAEPPTPSPAPLM